MRTIIMFVVLTTMILSTCFLSAQDTDNRNKIEELNQKKEAIVTSEREGLKKEVESINERLVKGEITTDEAQKLKETAAERRALNIENRLAIIKNKIALLERNDSEYLNSDKSKISIGLGAKDKDDGDILFGFNVNTGKKTKIRYDRRTYSDLVVAFGLNNAIVEGQSLDDSDYKIAGSRFFEIGLVWKTRVFKNSNFMRVTYGISYQSNGLKPTDNRYFVANGDQTELEEFRLELDKSKFRMDNMVVPMHLEFGPSKRTETEEKLRFSTHGKFRIGLGGYVGANISTRQKLKYKENGDRIKDKIKRDYNTSDLIYGLSTYIGFGDMSLYAKYDLSPIFQNASVDQNNVSLGLRFDL
ncbi:antitoxin VbhA family protein [Aquimarina sp. M1]